MLGELLLTFGIVLIAYAIYKLTTENAQYFGERNLKYRSTFVSVRDTFSMFLGATNVFDFTQKLYNSFPDEP